MKYFYITGMTFPLNPLHGLQFSIFPRYSDNTTTHFTASITAASVATLLTQPVDVMKTRMMNAPPGTYSGK